VLLSGFGGDEPVSARISLPWNELIREAVKVMANELYNGITFKALLKPHGSPADTCIPACINGIPNRRIHPRAVGQAVYQPSVAKRLCHVA
jgi:hypothetical protein